MATIQKQTTDIASVVHQPKLISFQALVWFNRPPALKMLVISVHINDL